MNRFKNKGFLFIVLLTLSAFSPILGTKAGGTEGRFFRTTLTPAAIDVSQTVQFTLMVTNDPMSIDNIGSINLTIPLGFTAVTQPVITSPSGAWITPVQTPTKIGMKPSSPQEALPPGQTLSIEFYAKAPALPGTSTWITQCTTNTGIGGIAFTLVPGTQQPIVITNPALVAPSINAFPSVVNQEQASSLTSSTVTTGSAPYLYQWFQKGPSDTVYSTVVGATSPSYSFQTELGTATGTWSFMLGVTDSAGVSVNSTTIASVLVNLALVAPIVTASASAVVQGQNSILTSSSIVTGTSPYVYQWFQKSPSDSGFVSIDGATSGAYVFSTTTSTVAGAWSYALRVIDNTGASATSNAISIMVNPGQYVITATAGSNGIIIPSGIVQVSNGANQVFAITPDTGYHIADVIVDGISMGPITSYQFTAVTTNHTIAARFEIDTFTITVIQSQNGIITPGTSVANYGDTPSFTVTPDVGYQVKQVLVDGAPASLDAQGRYTFSAINASHVITATFAIGTYTIVASAGANGAISPSGNVIVDYGAECSFIITAAANYHVLDVVVDGVSVGPVTSYTFTGIVSNHTIQASFEIDDLVIIAVAGSNGVVSPSGTVYVVYGGSQTFTFTPFFGYHVADVVVDGRSVGAQESYTFSHVVKGHTISATFAINTFTIAASAGPGGSITPSGAVNVNYGASQVFTITADTGYRIADVQVNGVSQGPIASYTFTNVQESQTITATFIMNTYMITASADSLSSISPSGIISVNYGASQTFTYSASPSYTVTHVLVDGVPVAVSGSYTFTNIQANHTITVSTTINTYTITASAGSGGSITPSGSVTLNSGTDQTFTITANEGYHIAEVIIDDLSLGAIDSYTFASVVADHTIYASFAINQYLITVISPHGSPTASALVNEGETFAVSVTSPEGNTLHRWICTGYSINGGPVIQGTSYTFVNVRANHTIVFNWQEQYYVTIVSPDGTTAGSGWYNSGANITVSVPNGVIAGDDGERQVFSGWSGDASGTGLISDPMPVDGPKTAIANWKTQYYLTVVSERGNPTGQGWYDSGSIATFSVTPAVNGISGVRFIFVSWTGTSGGYTGSAASSQVIMNSPVTETANWVTQYQVVYVATGNALQVTVPQTEWINSGGVATGKFPLSIMNSAQDTRCNFVSDNRPAAVTTPTTVTGTYETQYVVTFTQKGIASDALGTIVTVSGAARTYAQLADVIWVNNGGLVVFNYVETVETSDAGKQYVLNGINATSPLMITGPTIVQGNYEIQTSMSLSTIAMSALLLLALALLALLLLAWRRKKKITPIADEGGSISPGTTQKVKRGGDSPTFHITPRAGYEIADVVVDKVLHLGAVKTYQFTNVTSDHVISASFRKL